MPHPTQRQTTSIDFLRKIIAAPSVLSGYDLVTGEEYSGVAPEDVEGFLAAHMMGPARVAQPPMVNVTTPGGERQRRRTFVRATVLPFAVDDRCTHVALRFKTTDSMSPTEEIIAGSLALHRASIEHYIERSVLTGVWVLWLPFGSAVERAHAESLARRTREIMKQVGVVEDRYVIPLLEERRTPLHLPCMFYSGGFFGVLFEIDGKGRLHEVGASHVESVVPAAETSRTSVAAHCLEDLLEHWFLQHGTKAVRAGEMVSLLRQEGVLPVRLSALPPQAAAISLGRDLLELTKTGSMRIRVTASRSGKSNVFRIEMRGSAGASTHGT